MDSSSGLEQQQGASLADGRQELHSTQKDDSMDVDRDQEHLVASTSQTGTQEPPTPSIIHATQTSNSASTRCVGWRLSFAVHRTPIMEYPFALHTVDDDHTPWRWQVWGSTMFLIHSECAKEDDGVRFRQGCCKQCWSIPNYPTFSIVRSSVLGILPPPGAPLEHHSFNALLTRAKEKDQKLRLLEIQIALIARSLG